MKLEDFDSLAQYIAAKQRQKKKQKEESRRQFTKEIEDGLNKTYPRNLSKADFDIRSVDGRIIVDIKFFNDQSVSFYVGSKTDLSGTFYYLVNSNYKPIWEETLLEEIEKQLL